VATINNGVFIVLVCGSLWPLTIVFKMNAR
jgi:hypothetical protein